MAELFRKTGGAVAAVPTTAWTNASNLLTTVSRNDNGRYNDTGNRFVLPFDNLADGYLAIARVRYRDTSNGRANISLRIIEEGVFNPTIFVNSVGSSYTRNTSNQDAYITCWAFMHNPQFLESFGLEWKRDTNAPTGGTIESSFDIIPLYYADAGFYTSSSNVISGGVTPTVMGGFTGTNGANIALSGNNTVTLSNSNKRYLCFGNMSAENIGTSRTQRWSGFLIDGVQNNQLKGYAYARNASNANVGINFSGIIPTQSVNRTLQLYSYRGDGIGNLQGGADVDGSQAGINGAHAMVVLELHDNAEVFRTRNGTSQQQINNAARTDLNFAFETNFIDNTSFTRQSNTQVRSLVAQDALLMFNLSAASNDVTSGVRGEVLANISVNSVVDSNINHGNYIRGNQGTEDTFGYSANGMGFRALNANDDISLSTIRTGDGHSTFTVTDWLGAFGINLDTLEPSSGSIVDAGAEAFGSSVIALQNEQDLETAIQVNGASVLAVSAEASTVLDLGVSVNSGSTVSALLKDNSDVSINVGGTSSVIVDAETSTASLLSVSINSLSLVFAAASVQDNLAVISQGSSGVSLDADPDISSSVSVVGRSVVSVNANDLKDVGLNISTSTQVSVLTKTSVSTSTLLSSSSSVSVEAEVSGAQTISVNVFSVGVVSALALDSKTLNVNLSGSSSVTGDIESSQSISVQTSGLTNLNTALSRAVDTGVSVLSGAIVTANLEFVSDQLDTGVNISGSSGFFGNPKKDIGQDVSVDTYSQIVVDARVICDLIAQINGATEIIISEELDVAFVDNEQLNKYSEVLLTTNKESRVLLSDIVSSIVNTDVNGDSKVKVKINKFTELLLSKIDNSKFK